MEASFLVLSESMAIWCIRLTLDFVARAERVVQCFLLIAAGRRYSRLVSRFVLAPNPVFDVLMCNSRGAFLYSGVEVKRHREGGAAASA
jgi:hypothetical protein